MSNIAIFGGTFNPFHIGHYEMLSAVCNLSYIDKVLVMPNKIPPHKKFDNIVSDEHRQNMCKIVCEDFEKAEVCLVEFERDGKSYTVDTINTLKTSYPNDDFFVVVGGDMLSTLDTWYNWSELFKLTSFIAFKRKANNDFHESYNRISNLGGKVKIVESEITDVSSTTLRKTIDANLLPRKIFNYIVEKGIYNV